MADGSKVARRKTFADEYLGPNTKNTSCEPRSSVCERDDKQGEKDRTIHSRNSTSSLPVMDLSIDVLRAEGQNMSVDGPESPDEIKPAKAKINGVPINFGIVVPGVYRSGYPQADDFEFLKSLRLKTIVTLVQKDFPEGYQAFMRINGIRHFVIDMPGTKKVTITRAVMDSVMDIVLDQWNYPILVHCNHGKHRTGCSIAAVRKAMGWDTESIIREYSSYAEPKIREADIQYIQNFEITSLDSLVDNKLQLDGTSRFCDRPILDLKRLVKFVVLVVLTLGLWGITAACIRF